MKTILLLILSTIAGLSQTTGVWQTRMIQSQIQGAVGIPELVADKGERPSLPIGANGSRFELWGIQMANGSIINQKLIDTTEVGIYLPTAEINIATTDPFAGFHRTRVDQPFTVSYKISNLLAASPTVPTAATKVLVHHYVDLYSPEIFDGSSIESTVLFRSFELTSNGTHSFPFACTNLTAPDLIRRGGKERFVVYALADGSTPQREIAKTEVLVFPVSEGCIVGIDPTRIYRTLPSFNTPLWGSYPGSSTWVEIYDGEYSANTRGTPLATTFETPGRIVADRYTMLEFPSFPKSFQPVDSGKKTIVVRASSPFSNESVKNGGRVLAHTTITMRNTITVNGMLTTLE